MTGSSLYPEDLTKSLLFGDHVFSWICVFLASDGSASHGSKTESRKRLTGHLVLHMCAEYNAQGGDGCLVLWQGRRGFMGRKSEPTVEKTQRRKNRL